MYFPYLFRLARTHIIFSESEGFSFSKSTVESQLEQVHQSPYPKHKCIYVFA